MTKIFAIICTLIYVTDKFNLLKKLKYHKKLKRKMKWKLLPDICITGDDTSFLFLWHIFKSVASMETVSPDAKTITYFVKEFKKNLAMLVLNQ